MSLISEPQFTNIIKPGIFKIFVNYFNDLPRESLVGAMYRLEQSERSQETYLEIEDIGNVPVFTGDLTYTKFQEGYNKILVPNEYAMGMKLQRRLFDDDLYQVIDQMVGNMGTVARYRMEVDAIGPFINFTNTTYTVFDGLSLGNSAHTFNSVSTTQSNLGTTPFAYAALDAAVIAMRRFTDSQNRSIFTMSPDMLFGPVDLESQFREVIDSKFKPGTQLNNISAYNDTFTIRTSPLFSSTTNWFLIDSKKMKQFNIWQQRIPLELKNTGDFDSYAKKYALYMRYVNSPVHWVWAFCSNS
jgi:hypothetical protein